MKRSVTGSECYNPRHTTTPRHLKIWNRCILNNRILDWDRKKHQSDQTYPSQRIPRSRDRIQSFQSHFPGEKLLRYGYIIHTQVSSTITIFRQNKLPIVNLFCNVTSWSRNPGPPPPCSSIPPNIKRSGSATGFF